MQARCPQLIAAPTTDIVDCEETSVIGPSSTMTHAKENGNARLSELGTSDGKIANTIYLLVSCFLRLVCWENYHSELHCRRIMAILAQLIEGLEQLPFLNTCYKIAPGCLRHSRPACAARLMLGSKLLFPYHFL